MKEAGRPLSRPEHLAEPSCRTGSLLPSPPESIDLRDRRQPVGLLVTAERWLCERRVGATPRSGAVPSERRAFRAASREREGRERDPLTGPRRPGRDRRDLPRDRPRDCGSGAVDTHQQPTRIERRATRGGEPSGARPSRASCTIRDHRHRSHVPAHACRDPPVRGPLQRSRDRSAARWVL